MKKYWVYIHTCTANGKKYVGCTTRVKPEFRWKEGRGYKTNKHFYSAILKHGWSNFRHEAWELTCESEMYYAEKYLIAYYHTTDNKFGYNNSEGGEKSALGCTRSKEFRRKLSETNKERWADPEYRRKMSEAHKNKSFSEETKKKQSEACKKTWADPEFRKKRSEAMKGKPKPKIKIKLPDGTLLETTKQLLTRWYVDRNKEFEYVS